MSEEDIQRLRALSNLNLAYDFCLDHIAPQELVTTAIDEVTQLGDDSPAGLLGRVLSQDALLPFQAWMKAGAFVLRLTPQGRRQPQHHVLIVYIGLADFERVCLIPIHFEA